MFPNPKRKPPVDHGGGGGMKISGLIVALLCVGMAFVRPTFKMSGTIAVIFAGLMCGLGLFLLVKKARARYVHSKEDARRARFGRIKGGLHSVPKPQKGHGEVHRANKTKNQVR